MTVLNQTGLTEMGFSVEAAKKYWTSPRAIAVEIVALVPAVPPELTELMLSRRTKRGSLLQVGDFKSLGTMKGGLILRFAIAAEIPEGYDEVWGTGFARGRRVAMTFADFCWMCSNGTTPESALEVSVPAPDGTLIGDLTWALPGKFVDDLVETLYALNQDVLEGRMMDSWLVGPFRIDGPEIVDPA